MEPLKAACPCCPARLSSPTLRNASPLCAEATRVGPIAAALYNAPHLRVCIATWSALSFHSDPSTGFPFACLAALGSESRRWTEGVDPRICQTFAASPAEPGELPYLFRRAAFAPSPKILCDLLQQRENAPLIGQRFAGLAPGSAGWPHRVA